MAVSLYFDIFGRDKGVGKMLDDVGGKAEASSTKLGKMESGLGKLAGPALGIGTAVFGAGLQFGQMAATAEQNVGAVETVFGKAAGKVGEFASKSADAVGLSSTKYNELSAVTGTALKAAGVSVDQLAGKNDQLITRGADLASVFGGTTADAVGAMGSAFRGEFDSLEKYGVTLDMNKVSAQMAADGTDKLKGASLDAAKKQTILKLIMDESKDSAGNFAKEADTAAGAQERQAAAFEDTGAKLGDVLLPIMKRFSDMLTKTATWVGENKELVQNLGIGIGILAGSVALASGAMKVLNIVMSQNPLGKVIMLVGLLVGGFIWAYKNVGWFKDGVDAAWSGIQKAIGSVVKWFTGSLVPAFSKGLDGIKGFFEDTVKNVGRIWDGLKAIAAKPVRWVIETVINDGIVKGFNGFSKGLFGDGGPRLSPIQIGFAGGGYTGDGGKYEPKGVVHGGEFVFTKEETARAGVPLLSRVARALRGFADGGFVNPVDGGGTVTQAYRGDAHNGIDIAAPLNTKIMAAFAGNVTSAGWSPHGGGNEVHIKHADGWETWYAHLNRILVKAGQTVNRAVTIGLMGSTGNSTGSHVHYMLMKGGWPNHVDPAPYMSGKVPAISINPLAALFDTLTGGFKASGILGEITLQLGKKIMSSAGDFLMGGGTGLTMGPKVFDQGGWLEDMAVNRSGKPEAVLTHQQSRDFHKLATQGIDLDGYVLRLNADATMATFERIAGRKADEAVQAANDDIRRGRSRWM